MQVERLCKELGLPRQTVLQALKDAPPPDRCARSPTLLALPWLPAPFTAGGSVSQTQPASVSLYPKQNNRAQLSLLEARAAAEAAAAERQAVLRQAQAEAGGRSSGGRQPAKAAAAERSGGGAGGSPAWKQFKRNKGLGRQAEATLEMMYSRTQVGLQLVGQLGSNKPA